MSSCKYLFLLFAFIVFTRFDPTRASQLDDKENDKKYIAFEETMLILQEYGKFYKEVGNSSALKVIANDSSIFEETSTAHHAPSKLVPFNTDVNGAEVKLFLHTADEPEGVEIDINNLEETPFNPSNPTRIVCHGWMSNSERLMVQGITQAYVTKGNNNVIAVDWSAYSGDILYPLPVKYTEGVGKYIADVIDALVERRNAQYSDFHVIGHSLGAHVAGFVGANTKEKIGRITGLDPALPGFQYTQGREGRLDDTDATFVDVIHTCSGLLGMSVPVGHVDFFPNGGSPFQPGCASIILPEFNMCSHGRSHQFFSESISDASEFAAIKCQDWDHFKKGHCEKVYALMGEPVSRSARGVFYLNTRGHAPFAKGLNGTVY